MLCVTKTGVRVATMVVAAGTLVPAGSVSAQLVNTDWNKDAGDFLWATAGNWTNGVPNGANASARFKNAITQARTITIANAGVDVGQLVFETDDKKKSYTIAGGPLTFKNATQNRILLDANNKAGHVISANIKVDLNDLILEAANAQFLDFAQRTRITGGLFELNNTARALRVRGQRSQFDLDTDSNFMTGGTFIEQGNLRVKSDKSLGNGNKDVSIISGDLAVADKFATTRKIAVGKAANQPRASLSALGDAAFNGVISGSGGLILSGTAGKIIQLTADNTWTGDTDIIGTQVDISKASNLGVGAAKDYIALAAATLNVSGDADLKRGVLIIQDSKVVVAAKKTVTVDRLDGVGGGVNGALDIFRKEGAGSFKIANKSIVPLLGIELNEGELEVAGRVIAMQGIGTDLLGKPKMISGGGVIEAQIFTAPAMKLKPKKGNKESVEWHMDQIGDLSITGDTSFEMGVTMAGGTAGQTMGWGLWNVTGNLLLSNTPSNPMTVELVSLDTGDNPYYVSDFDPAQAYAWKFIGVTGGSISGFDPSAFVVDASGFWNLTYGGAFSVSMLSDGLYVNFTPMPSAGPGSVLCAAGLIGARRRRRA